MSISGTLNKVTRRGRREASALKDETLAIAAMMFAMLDDTVFNPSGGLSNDSRAQMGGGIVNTVITVVIVGVVGIVGILIFSEVDQAVEVTGNLSDSADQLSDGFGSAMELLPIVLIVLVASLVIAVIARFR